jgi:hypothetical protein
MSFTIADIIKITAEAIKGGIKPAKLIKDPTKILSGETKKILTSKKGSGIRLAEHIIDNLIGLGEKIDKDTLEWHHFHNIPSPETKYTVFEDRENKTLLALVELGKIKNLGINKVPIEDWSWNIECTSDVFAQEYVAYFI